MTRESDIGEMTDAERVIGGLLFLCVAILLALFLSGFDGHKRCKFDCQNCQGLEKKDK